jgi:hypothetical protein
MDKEIDREIKRHENVPAFMKRSTYFQKMSQINQEQKADVLGTSRLDYWWGDDEVPYWEYDEELDRKGSRSCLSLSQRTAVD